MGLARIRIARWPEDFQQVLLDLFDCHVGILPHDKYLLAYMGKTALVRQNQPIAKFFPELECQIESWEPHDDDHAVAIAEALRQGAKFPPLIARGLSLQDGYHRLWGLRENKMTHFDVLHLEDQPVLFREAVKET